jgi:hypothetical protein
VVMVRACRRGCEERGGAGVVSRLDTTPVPVRLKLIVLVIVMDLRNKLAYYYF